MNGRQKRARRQRGSRTSELAAVWRSLGVVREATGDFEGALEALRAAIRLLEDDPEAQAAAYQVRALSLLRLGNYAGALKETTSGLKLVEGSSSETGAAIGARLTAIRADIRLQQGKAREAIRLAQSAVETAERTGARDALARAYSALDRAYQQLGEPSKAVFERQAVEIYREIGELRSAALVEMNLGVQAFAEGRWDEAVERYASADRELQRVGDAASAAMVSANLAEILISHGELDRAKTLLEEARETLRASGARGTSRLRRHPARPARAREGPTGRSLGVASGHDRGGRRAPAPLSRRRRVLLPRPRAPEGRRAREGAGGARRGELWSEGTG